MTLPALALGIPTIANSPRLDECVRSVLGQEWIAHDVVIVCNGPGAEPRCGAWEARGLEVHRPGDNPGVAASWNHGCRRAWSRGHDAVVLLNDDVVLTDRFALFRVRGAVDAEPRCLYFLNASRFAAFCVTRAAWDEVGEFDEGYWPAYYEDCDWHYRARLRGIPWVELAIAAGHAGGGSRTADPGLQALVEQTFPANAQRYCAKWGGLPDEERYTTPWGDGEPLPPVRRLVGAA